MSQPGKTPPIQCAYYRHDTYPETIKQEICEDFYSLLIPVARANVRLEREGRLLYDGELVPGMMRLAAPGERVEIMVRTQVQHIDLTIPGPWLRKTLDNAGYRQRDRTGYFAPVIRPSRTVARVAGALLVASQLEPFQRQMYIEGLTHSLLACLMIDRRTTHDPQMLPPGRALTDAEFARCTLYADKALDRGLGLTEWAAAVDMPAGEFARRFRKRTSQSPYAWFLDRRVERAKQLLRQTDVSIAEVALSVGFCSQSHLTEAFRRRVGCSPARWKAAGFGRNFEKSRILKDAVAAAS